MQKHPQASIAVQTEQIDSPEDMLKRLFAVAELVAQALHERQFQSKRTRMLSDETRKEQTNVS